MKLCYVPHSAEVGNLKTMITMVLELVAPQWTPEILFMLESGPMRYSDLQHIISMTTTQKVHSSTFSAALDHLEARNLIEHREAVYQLTNAGLSLLEDLLHPASDWGERHRQIIGS